MSLDEMLQAEVDRLLSEPQVPEDYQYVELIYNVSIGCPIGLDKGGLQRQLQLEDVPVDYLKRVLAENAFSWAIRYSNGDEMMPEYVDAFERMDEFDCGPGLAAWLREELVPRGWRC